MIPRRPASKAPTRRACSKWRRTYTVCLFACERKETSKAGSILILRFFHAYSCAEIALLLRAGRNVVDSRLNLARQEARVYLEDPEKIKVIGKPEPRTLPRPSLAGSTEELLLSFRKVIFASTSGHCLSKTRMRDLYRDDSLQVPDHSILAHIVSCERCLGAVSKLLNLPPLSDRGFTGSDSGQQPPNGKTPAKPNGDRPQKDRIARWKRLARAISDHYPRELLVSVNGMPLAWEAVGRDGNDFSLRLQQSEPVEFVEVLSEQGIRLLSLTVPETPPNGPGEIKNEVELSDDRHISLSLRFETLWPTVHVCYSGSPAPIAQIEPTPKGNPETLSVAFRVFSWLFSARVLTPALAVFLIFALLFYQTRETTVSAATLLAKAEAWGRDRVGARSGCTQNVRV
jgi:hypothetical protein